MEALHLLDGLNWRVPDQRAQKWEEGKKKKVEWEKTQRCQLKWKVNGVRVTFQVLTTVGVSCSVCPDSHLSKEHLRFPSGGGGHFQSM